MTGSRHKLFLNLSVTEDDIYGYDLYTMEYVQVKVTISHPNRGHLEVKLTCPSGTESVIGARRPHDKYVDISFEVTQKVLPLCNNYTYY